MFYTRPVGKYVINLWALRRRLAPLAVLLAALALPVLGVVAINTDAAGEFTLLSENTGVNFFLAQCDGGSIVAYGPHSQFQIETPVYTQNHSSRAFVFYGHDIWDDGFFLHEGMQCIRRDGISHLQLIGQHVLDLTVTSVPWPQYDDPGMRGIARTSNLAYGLLLPTVIVAGLFAFMGKDRGSRGARLVMIHLVCLLPTVIVFLSEPRFRVPYDVFGLALAAALTDRILGHRRRPAPSAAARTSPLAARPARSATGQRE